LGEVSLPGTESREVNFSGMAARLVGRTTLELTGAQSTQKIKDYLIARPVE